MLAFFDGEYSDNLDYDGVFLNIAVTFMLPDSVLLGTPLSALVVPYPDETY